MFRRLINKNIINKQSFSLMKFPINNNIASLINHRSPSAIINIKRNLRKAPPMNTTGGPPILDKKIIDLLTANKPEKAYQLYTEIVSKGPPSQEVAKSMFYQLCTGYPAGTPDYPKAEQVFQDLERINALAPDIYELMMMASIDSQRMDKMNYYYKHMVDNHIKPTADTFNVLLTGFMLLNDNDAVEKLKKDMEKLGIKPNKDTNVLLKAYAGDIPPEIQDSLKALQKDGSNTQEQFQKAMDSVKNLDLENMDLDQAFSKFQESLDQMNLTNDPNIMNPQDHVQSQNELERLRQETAELKKVIQDLESKIKSK